MYYFGPSRGWGHYVEKVIPARYDVAEMVTEFYTTSVSVGRLSRARARAAEFGRTVFPRTQANVPEFIADPRFIEGGMSVGCVLLNPDGSIAGSIGKPCVHINIWERGPNLGRSWCDLRSCMTVGHRDQGGYQTFLAHNEIWSWVVWIPGTRSIEFVPCGPRCDTGTSTTTPPPTTNPPPTSSPPPTSPPVCPVDTPPGTPGCVPLPPDPCSVPPLPTECVPFDPSGVTFEVVIDHPAQYAAKGSLLEQGASVRSTRLLCDGDVCAPGPGNLDPSKVSLTGTLELASSVATYRECQSATSSPCAFLPRALDRDRDIRPGDLVSAYFFTPTRSSERVNIRIDTPRGRVQTYRWEPVYQTVEIDCPDGTPGCFDVVFTGEYQRVRDQVIDVPVVVRDATGRTLPAAGVFLQVIGSIGD